jgi:hypothetical protein
MAEQESWYLKWQLLVADAWADPELKKRLLKDPQAVLAERGIKPPEGKQFRVIEETAECVPLVLPAKPEQAELSEEQLEGVAGGHGPWGPCCPPPCGGFGPCCPPPCPPPCGGFPRPCCPPPCRPW